MGYSILFIYWFNIFIGLYGDVVTECESPMSNSCINFYKKMYLKEKKLYKLRYQMYLAFAFL